MNQNMCAWQTHNNIHKYTYKCDRNLVKWNKRNQKIRGNRILGHQICAQTQRKITVQKESWHFCWNLNTRHFEYKVTQVWLWDSINFFSFLNWLGSTVYNKNRFDRVRLYSFSVFFLHSLRSFNRKSERWKMKGPNENLLPDSGWNANTVENCFFIGFSIPHFRFERKKKEKSLHGRKVDVQ